MMVHPACLFLGKNSDIAIRLVSAVSLLLFSFYISYILRDVVHM